MYNYVIVGAGPTGLRLAYTLSDKYKVLLIDQFPVIGGCNRSLLINNCFSEHAPRVFSSAYINTINWFYEMNIKFTDYYTPYKFSMLNIGSKSPFNIIELLYLIIGYFICVLFPMYSKYTSVQYFTSMFSLKSQDYLDRLCMLTDGAESKRYSIYKFYQLLNIQFLYTLYEPRYPNNEGIFSIIYKVLKNKGVDIMLNTSVTSLITKNNKVVGLNNNIYGENFILAIPPTAINKITNTFNNLQHVVKYNSYINYVSVVYKWNTKLNLPKIHGFPTNDWGVVFIVMSDYFKNSNETIISTTAYYTNVKSKNINKTLNECDENEVINEIFNQLPFNIPRFDTAVMNPFLYRKNNEWINTEIPFVDTCNTRYLPFTSNRYYNLYNCGYHNGYSSYTFNSFESAVVNAQYLLNKLKCAETIYSTITLNQIMILLVVMSIVVFRKNDFSFLSLA